MLSAYISIILALSVAVPRYEFVNLHLCVSWHNRLPKAQNNIFINRILVFRIQYSVQFQSLSLILTGTHINLYLVKISIDIQTMPNLLRQIIDNYQTFPKYKSEK